MCKYVCTLDSASSRSDSLSWSRWPLVPLPVLLPLLLARAGVSIHIGVMGTLMIL
jgi:hypothetical protein